MLEGLKEPKEDMPQVKRIDTHFEPLIGRGRNIPVEPEKAVCECGQYSIVGLKGSQLALHYNFNNLHPVVDFCTCNPDCP